MMIMNYFLPAALCMTTYEQENGRRYVGGDPESGVNSETACREACTATPQCLGYDYNQGQSENYRCWSFINKYEEATQSFPDRLVVHYSRRRTCGGKALIVLPLKTASPASRLQL